MVERNAPATDKALLLNEPDLTTEESAEIKRRMDEWFKKIFERKGNPNG